jgi:hypothetical protein
MPIICIVALKISQNNITFQQTVDTLATGNCIKATNEKFIQVIELTIKGQNHKTLYVRNTEDNRQYNAQIKRMCNARTDAAA